MTTPPPLTTWDRYGKALAAVILAAVTATTAALSDRHVTTAEWLQIAIATVTAILVYLVPAAPGWPWAKSAVGVVLAGLNAAATLIVGGWNTGSGTEIVLAILTAVFVRFSPATSTTGVPAE